MFPRYNLCVSLLLVQNLATIVGLPIKIYKQFLLIGLQLHIRPYI